jgi:DNA-binding GntR family transcriptional regulator
MRDPLSNKVRAQSLVDAVTERLEKAILSGACEPGSKLSEQALAKSLGVSRAPLREAIRRLEGRKLLKRTPNVGVRVATLSADDMADIFQVHEALQGLACGLAATNMSDSDIASLKDLLSRHERQVTTPESKEHEEAEDFNLDLEFHFHIARGSGNKRLSEMLFEDLSYLIWSNRFISNARPSRWKKALQEHKGIVAAISRRDSAAAEQKMREHIRNDWNYVKEQLAALLEKSGTEQAQSDNASITQRLLGQRIVPI